MLFGAPASFELKDLVPYSRGRGGTGFVRHTRGHTSSELLSLPVGVLQRWVCAGARLIERYVPG